MANLTLQNSYGFKEFSMVPGQLMEAFGPRQVSAKIARGLLTAGCMAFKVPTVGGAGSRNGIDPGEAFQYVIGGTTASATAVLASGGASSTSQQVITSFNGSLGAGPFQPARAVTMTLNNNANWDATTAVLRGYNHLGQIVSENLSIPDAGNTTLTSANLYTRLISLTIPAQSGTGGTYTLGVAAVAAGALTAADFYGVVVYQAIKTTPNSAGLYGYPGVPSGVTADYADSESAPLLVEGGIACVTETTFTTNAPVYCRIAAGAGGSTIGAFRTDADSSTAILVPNARCRRDATAGTAWLHFSGIC